MPRATVIIPTYHWSTVLPYSIGSVLRQTFTDFELLVVGDGCRDDSPEVVGRLAASDPRVRWINLSANTGHQSGPNNEGIRQAKGQIIAYLGHDDLWLPRHLELAVQAIDAGADLTYSLAEMVPARVNETPTVEPSEMEHYAAEMWIPPSVVTHRKSLAEKVRGWKRFVDLDQDPEADLWQRMHEAGAKFQFIRRLTAVKFPAIWRKGAYRLKKCDEQAVWSARIAAEADFEAVELARMIAPTFVDGRDVRPLRQVVSEFAEVIKSRALRRLRGIGALRAPDREYYLKRRRKFKGVS